MGWPNLLVPAMILATCVAASAQSPTYNLGRTPSAEEIRAWDIAINDEGKELPPGSGTAVEGAKLYVAKQCVVCHGPNGRGGQAPPLVKRKDVSSDTGTSFRPERIVPVYAPFATVLWDYISRAMPLKLAPGTLKPDEVYALTAYLLYKNDVINENDVLNAQTLPKIKMPNHEFIPPDITNWKPGMPRSFTITPDPAENKK